MLDKVIDCGKVNVFTVGSIKSNFGPLIFSLKPCELALI